MSSSPERPLAFFESFISPEGFKNVLNRQLEFVDGQVLNIDLQGQEVIVIERNEFGEYKPIHVPIEQIYTSVLFREFNKAKENLYIFSITYPNKAENYLKIQINVLSELLTKRSNSLPENMFLDSPIKGLIRYINEILIGNEKPEVETSELYPVSNFNTREKVLSIIGFLKGKNEKQEQILTSEDFDLLVQYVMELIECEICPENITKKLNPNITSELLRFTFWVLHKEIYTTGKIRDYFLDFLKAAFVKFDNSETRTLKRNFSKSSAIFNHNFIPEIISQHLK